VLSSEAEFTEEYWLNAYDRGERSPKTSRWHRVMVEFVKQLDHGRHLVTTHFSHPHRGQITWSQNHGLDYVQSNAYTTFWFPGFGGNGHIGSGQGAPHALRVYFERYMKKFNRPVIVGEWGGHWMRNETPVLEGELRTGCWGAACTGLSGNTGFWWWPYIHFGKNYQPYAAVARFMRGEDRRGLDLSDANVSVLADQGRLRAVGVANNRRADVYVYGRTAPMSLHNVVPVSGADLLLQGLADGTYKVEFWDCAEGRPTGTRQVTSTNGRLRVDLPRVSIDVALKIRPARGR
jgi:hypothetical protein